MHMNDDGELGGIGSKLKKAAKKVKKATLKISPSNALMKKAAPSLAPQTVTQKVSAAVEKITAPITAAVEKVTAPIVEATKQSAVAPIAAMTSRQQQAIVVAKQIVKKPLTVPTFTQLMKPLVDARKVVSNPLSFRKKGAVEIAPRAAIPQRDYDGTEMTRNERDAMIDQATPMVEPIASGYYPQPEQVFEPEVPEMVEPDEVPTVNAKPPKKMSLPLLGGILLLLNFL